MVLEGKMENLVAVALSLSQFTKFLEGELKSRGVELDFDLQPLLVEFLVKRIQVKGAYPNGN